jgi:hypothetical protein
MAQTPPYMAQPRLIDESIKITYPEQLTERQKYEKSISLNKQGRPYTKYYIEVNQYYLNINIASNCSAITFINYGSNQVNINGVILTQGQQLTIEGNVNEIDQTTYQIQFTGSQANNNLTVIKKLYV